MGELRILDGSGDNRVQWDPKNDDEVDVAEMSFDKLKAKGYQAYEVDKEGKKGKLVKKFRAALGMIIMVPAIAGG
jgi:hypothetical protein